MTRQPNTQIAKPLPERLRDEFLWRDVELKKLAYEAADEIERLQMIIKSYEDADASRI